MEMLPENMCPEQDSEQGFELQDQSDQSGSVTGGIEVNERGVFIRFDGYTDYGTVADLGIPVMIEFYEGSPRVVVWADVNQEAPTHVIPLTRARNENRKED